MTYTRLPTRNLDKIAGLLRPVCILPERVKLDNPALDVMTDFRRLTAFIATPGDTIRQAEERMFRRKVRLLFVMDAEDRVAGLVTSTDIHGEKPMQLVQSRGIRRDEVLVADIMTPVDRLEAVDFEDLSHARVGHVVATLQAVGRQHAMIADFHNGAMKVRGLFSLSQVARQLGTALETVEVARSFAQVEEMLAH